MLALWPAVQTLQKYVLINIIISHRIIYIRRRDENEEEGVINRVDILIDQTGYNKITPSLCKAK